MVTAFVRTILLYFIIMLGLRLMGKRQIGLPHTSRRSRMERTLPHESSIESDKSVTIGGIGQRMAAKAGARAGLPRPVGDLSPLARRRGQDPLHWKGQQPMKRFFWIPFSLLLALFSATLLNKLLEGK